MNFRDHSLVRSTMRSFACSPSGRLSARLMQGLALAMAPVALLALATLSRSLDRLDKQSPTFLPHQEQQGHFLAETFPGRAAETANYFSPHKN